MIFVNSAEMKIELTPEQSEMLSTKENIKLIIRNNPDTVMAFDIMDENSLIGFVLVHRFEDRMPFHRRLFAVIYWISRSEFRFNKCLCMFPDNIDPFFMTVSYITFSKSETGSESRSFQFGKCLVYSLHFNQ